MARVSAPGPGQGIVGKIPTRILRLVPECSPRPQLAVVASFQRTDAKPHLLGICAAMNTALQLIQRALSFEGLG